MWLCSDKDLGEVPLTRPCCQFFVVFLSEKDTDAVRFYEDTEFTRARHLSVHRYHNIMELPRERFEELYRR